MRRIVAGSIMVIAALGTVAMGQNTNSSQTVRPRTTTSPNTNKAVTEPEKNTDVQKPATTPPAPTDPAMPPAGDSTPPAPMPSAGEPPKKGKMGLILGLVVVVVALAAVAYFML